MLARLFFAIFLCLALTLSLVHRTGYTTVADYEEGDDAANAFRITRAKHCDEILGNYSRWNFNHPGPAFFYVYAAGETVLYDWLKAVPTVRNAHLYAGLLLQLAFLAAALALVARESSHPWLLAGLLTFAAGWHYSHAQGALYSIWPPHVLLMPFLCFLVACAAFSLGRRDALPWLVLAGGFLVHGHIVMLLFVGLLTALAGGMGLRRAGRALLAPGGILAVTGTLLVLFALPLILDLLAGRDSNAYRVFLYLHFQQAADATWRQSFLVWLSYFVYTHNQDIFNQLNPASYADFHARWPIFLLWTGLVALPWVVRRLRPRLGNFSLLMSSALLAFFAAASILTFLWGLHQSGGFTYYNSYFNHSLVFLLVLSGLLGAIELLPAGSPAWPALPVGLAALVAFSAWLKFSPADSPRAHLVRENLPALLAADPQPGSSKILLFDTSGWYEAATLGRALQSCGIPFRVNPFWRLMFTDDHIINGPGPDFQTGRASVWRLVRRDQVPESRPLTREFGVLFEQPKPLGSLPATINFVDSRSNEDYALFGIDGPEAEWAWTTAKLAAVEFVPPPSATDVLMKLDAGLIFDEKNGSTSQQVRLYFNGHLLLDRNIHRRSVLSVRIPAQLWQSPTPARIVISIPLAVAPSQLHISPDQRILGLQLHELDFSAAPP